MTFFNDQIQKIKDYFKNNNFITIILNFIYPLFNALFTIYSFISKNLVFLLITNCITIVIFILFILYTKNKCIKINDLSYKKRAFLVNMIINIYKIRELKKNQDLSNHIGVSELHAIFNIEKTGSNTNIVSPLNVQWEINCKSAERKIPQYNLLFSIAPTTSKPNVSAIIKNIHGNEVQAHVTPEDIQDKTVNFYNLTFQNFDFGTSGSYLTIHVKDYYTFRWDDYETLLINPYAWGDSVDKTTITLIFSDDQIKNTDIELFAVNQTNLRRTLLKREVCSQDTNGNYIFKHEHTKKTTDNIFFLIVIPPKK